MLQYPVYLTEGQARGAARLRVSYLSAISVAPEGSELTGLVNGTKVGWTRIQAPAPSRSWNSRFPTASSRPATTP